MIPNTLLTPHAKVLEHQFLFVSHREVWNQAYNKNLSFQ